MTDVPTSDPGGAPGGSDKRLSKGGEERRKVLRSIAVGGAVTCAALAGLLQHRTAHADPRLRPPGSLDEEAFLAACIKCGQCVQVCPIQAIELADLTRGLSNGTPYIVARDQACDFSCDATQCILACPTGALSHEIDKKEQVKMGVAALARPDACLARKGQGWKGPARGAGFDGVLRWAEIDRWKAQPIAGHAYDLDICDLCVTTCPIEGAIALEPLNPADPADRRRTPVVKPSCVGCGVCEMMCPVDPVAIAVTPTPVGREPERKRS